MIMEKEEVAPPKWAQMIRAETTTAEKIGHKPVQNVQNGVWGMTMKMIVRVEKHVMLIQAVIMTMIWYPRCHPHYRPFRRKLQYHRIILLIRGSAVKAGLWQLKVAHVR